MAWRVDQRIWTVRQEGRGGTVLIGGEVRPITQRESTLVQGLPNDYFDHMIKAGVEPDQVSKGTALGWPARTAVALFRSIFEVSNKWDTYQRRRSKGG